MKKMKNPLFLAAGVLVILGAAYVGISQMNASAEKKEEEQKEYVVKMDDVSELSFYNGKDVLGFVRVGEEWEYKTDPEFPLNQNIFSRIETDASDLEPVRILKDAEATDVYGLDEPQYWVQMTGTDGTVKKVQIGDQTDTNYYACVEGEETVYTISSSLPSELQYDLYDLIQLESIQSVSADQILSVTVEKTDGNGYFLQKEEKEIAKEAESSGGTDMTENSGEADMTESSSEEDVTESEPESPEDTELVVEWYIQDQDRSEERRKLEASGTGDVVTDAISSLYVSSCENYKATDEMLEEYGLGQPIQITYTYETVSEDGSTKEESMTLKVGNIDENGEYYFVNLPESMAINKVNAENLKKVIEKAPENFQ